MSTHKNIDRICVVIIVLCLILTLLFMNGQALGLQSASRTMGYEQTLFDTSKVHTIDILIDDWDINLCYSPFWKSCFRILLTSSLHPYSSSTQNASSWPIDSLTI